MAENQKKIEDQQKKMVSISGSHSGTKMNFRIVRKRNINF